MSIISNTGRTLFSGYNVVATPTTGYVYTTNGSTGADDGWISCKADDISISFAVATLNATTVLLRIEGRFDTYSRAASLYAESITAEQAIDKIVRITDKVKEVRVGLRTDASDILVASPNNVYCGLCLSEGK